MKVVCASNYTRFDYKINEKDSDINDLSDADEIDLLANKESRSELISAAVNFRFNSSKSICKGKIETMYFKIKSILKMKMNFEQCA